MEAGHQLIAEKGVAGLRIAEITERAGVALGSFYNHFETKEDLVEAVVSDTLASLAGAIVDDDPQEGEAMTVAVAALRRLVRIAYEDREFARLLVELGRGDELFLDALHPYARTALQRGIDEGVFDIADLEVAITATVGGGLAMIRSILDGRHGPDADVPHAAMVMRSFGVDHDTATRVAATALEPQSVSMSRGGA